MKRRRWSAEEINLLQKRYASEGPKPLALEMGRSEDSVSSFARKCGLRMAQGMEWQEASTALPEAVPSCVGADAVD